MPCRAHISFIVDIKVAIPAWGSLMIDEAMAAPPTVVLAAGTSAACDMALEVALTICTIVEEVDVVLLTCSPQVFKVAQFFQFATTFSELVVLRLDHETKLRLCRRARDT